MRPGSEPESPNQSSGRIFGSRAVWAPESQSAPLTSTRPSSPSPRSILTKPQTARIDVQPKILFRSRIAKMECDGGEVPGVSCGSWLKAGTPPLRESCACPRGALFEAADSAYTLRRVRHPTSRSTCRTQGQPRSLGRRVGSFGRISACPATAVTLLTHHAKPGFELKMSG